MIAYLEGELGEKSPTHAVLLVGGVGYKLNIPVSTYYELPEIGGKLCLRVHTHVREDVLALYGFSSSMEEQLFQRLITVAGVGPALALKIMSGLEPEVLVDSIRTGDVRRLNAIPGVGKKTAERLILELRDKLPEVAVSKAGPTDEGPQDSVVALVGDLVSALENLGFPRAQVERQVKAVVADDATIGFEDALKRVLRELSA